MFWRARFWVPLIGLYSGLRLNEICSLAADDGELCSLKAKPNFRALGKRFGKRMKAAAAAIGEMSSEAAFGVLSRLAIDSADANTRASAVRALEEADANLAVPLLVQVLSQDADAAVRRRAALTLGDIESGQAVAALRSAATNDADVGVRRAAVNALGDIGSPAAREALIQLLNRN